MRVLLISYELPPIGGGGGRAALHIAHRLVRRGHAVQILSSRFGDLLPEEEHQGVRISRLAVRRKKADECGPLELLSFMRRSLSVVTPLADAFRAQVTLAFFGIPGGPPAWWLARRRGTPYVLSLRGSDVPRPEMARQQRLHLFTGPFLRRLYRGASGVAAVSPSLRAAALAVAPDVQIDVIPNGVDTDRFRPPEQPVRRPDHLLFVGRLRDFKGVQFLLRALPQIERALGRPVQVTVVGDGPMRADLEAIADENRRGGSKSEVTFTGWLEPDRVRPMYDGASLFVLPSRVEGHPNVVLEAMAAGLPIVATDVPGTRDTLKNGREALLVPPENAQALAESVVAILSDPERRETMAREARARAMEFSWDTITERYEQLLQRAVGGGK